MAWHWDDDAGRRVPTRRRALVARLVERILGRVSLVAVGLPLWVWGIFEVVTGSYYGGGALVFAGGVVLVMAAGGGWRRFRAALLDWLGGPA